MNENQEVVVIDLFDKLAGYKDVVDIATLKRSF